MNRLERIKRLKDLGLFSECVKDGIISMSVNSNYEIYNYFNVRMIVNKEFKNCKSRSYLEVCEQFIISEMTVRRAIAFIES